MKIDPKLIRTFEETYYGEQPQWAVIDPANCAVAVFASEMLATDNARDRNAKAKELGIKGHYTVAPLGN